MAGVTIDAGSNGVLSGDLLAPADREPVGAIVVPHLSRLERDDPYTRTLIAALGGAGLSTLLFDCLTEHEKVSVAPPSDALVIAQRVISATRFLRSRRETAHLALGYFASGDGTASSMHAAAKLGGAIQAVASLGPCREFHRAPLEDITAPVLLIVGGSAEDLESGCTARERLGSSARLEIVPGVMTSPIGNPGPRIRAIRLATEWLSGYVRPQSDSADRTAGSPAATLSHR